VELDARQPRLQPGEPDQHRRRRTALLFRGQLRFEKFDGFKGFKGFKSSGVLEFNAQVLAQNFSDPGTL
jgi:hypothetical protein